MVDDAKKAVYRYIGDRYYPDPQFPLAVVCSLIRQYEPIHTHDFAEIVFVTGGSAIHLVGDGERSVRIEAGDVLLVAHGEKHGYSQANGLALDNLVFRNDLFAGPTRIAALDAFSVIEPLYRLPIDARTVHLSSSEQARTTLLLKDLRTELTQRLPGSRALALARFVECVVIAGRASLRQRSVDGLALRPPKEPETPVTAAIEFMRLHFPEDLTLSEIAATVNLAPRHFCTVFKRHAGHTPWQFLRTVRTDHAAYLLMSQPTLSISQIAFAVGYSDPAYFARAFRAIRGVSPTEYRVNGAAT